MNKENLSNSNSLNKGTRRRGRARRSKQMKLHQQQKDQIESIFMELKSLREFQQDTTTELNWLHEYTDEITHACLKQQKDIKELRYQVQSIQSVPSQIEEGLDSIIHGFHVVQERLQQQQQQQPLYIQIQQEKHI